MKVICFKKSDYLWHAILFIIYTYICYINANITHRIM